VEFVKDNRTRPAGRGRSWQHAVRMPSVTTSIPRGLAEWRWHCAHAKSPRVCPVSSPVWVAASCVRRRHRRRARRRGSSIRMPAASVLRPACPVDAGGSCPHRGACNPTRQLLRGGVSITCAMYVVYGKGKMPYPWFYGRKAARGQGRPAVWTFAPVMKTWAEARGGRNL